MPRAFLVVDNQRSAWEVDRTACNGRLIAEGLLLLGRRFLIDSGIGKRARGVRRAVIIGAAEAPPPLGAIVVVDEHCPLHRTAIIAPRVIQYGEPAKNIPGD